MEPELPTPRLNPERSPVTPELAPERSPLVAPEVQPERAAERFEQRSEAGARAADAAAPVLSLPTPIPVTDDNDQSAAVGDDMPLVAADEDVIEKEWVDKAKQILSQTKDDPYRREEEISRLQMEYLQKRYGKEIGAQ